MVRRPVGKRKEHAMNCKKGDLAFVVRKGNEGLIVRCLSRFDGPWKESKYCRGWWVDPPVPNDLGEVWPKIADKNLRPIRDSDGEDEMLRLVGRPVGTLQDA